VIASAAEVRTAALAAVAVEVPFTARAPGRRGEADRCSAV
jgi:hypothetical protein